MKPPTTDPMPPSKPTITKQRIAAAAFIFFLVKGLFWLATGTGLVLAAR